MKRLLVLFLLSFFLFSGLLLSCKSNAPLTENKEKIITIKEIVKDTVLKIEKDSSYYAAYIDCVNGKPVIRELQKPLPSDKDTGQSKKGKNLDIPNVKIDGNILKVSCYQEARDLFFKWKEQYIKEFEKETKIPPPVIIERNFSWWEMTQLWIGRIVLFITGISLILWAIKKYFKYKSQR